MGFKSGVIPDGGKYWTHLQVELRGNGSSRLRVGQFRGKKVALLNCFEFFPPHLRVRMGYPDCSGVGAGGGQFLLPLHL